MNRRLITSTVITVLTFLIIQGCIVKKDIKEITQTTGRIILDTTSNYKPAVGDLYLFEVRWSTSFRLLMPYNEILDSITAFLVFYPDVICEIGVHTDFRGSTAFNDTLSYRRAKLLTDYIVKKGVDPRRIVPVGYGESVPRILEADIYVPDWKTTLEKGAHLTEEYINQLKTQKEKEAAHQLNRRVELKVTGFL